MEESLLDDDDFVGDGEILNPKRVVLNVLACSRSGCVSKTSFGEEDTHIHEDDIATTTSAQNGDKKRRFERVLVVCFSRMFLCGNESKKGCRKVFKIRANNTSALFTPPYLQRRFAKALIDFKNR